MNMITIDRSVVQQGLEALVQIYQRAATAETQALSDAVLLWSANADNTPESVRVEIQEVLWIRSSITALRAALAQQEEGGGNLPPPLPAEPEPETCTWHQDGDSDSGVYATSCRHYFNLEDGTPEDNKLAWCCYCGKKLTQELITENSDD